MLGYGSGLRALSLVSAVGACGCVASIDEGNEREPGVSSQQESLESFRTGRTKDDFPATVWITGLPGGCSGALIGPDLIVTAAHCVETLPNGSVRKVRIINTIDGETRCLTDLDGNATGWDKKCDDSDDEAEVVVFWNTDYQHLDDYDYDVAVLKLRNTSEQIRPGFKKAVFAGMEPNGECAPTARGTKPRCYLRIYADAIEPGRWFEWYGWGRTAEGRDDAGEHLNWGLTKVDSVGRHHFRRNTAESDLERTCKGDSGGPAIAPSSDPLDYLLLLGTTTIMDTFRGQCADARGVERWATTSHHMWLIENKPSNSRPGAGRICTKFTGNSYSYYKCFDSNAYQ